MPNHLLQADGLQPPLNMVLGFIRQKMKKWVIVPDDRANIDILPPADEHQIFKEFKHIINKERNAWDENYKRSSYSDVWSLTEDMTVCKLLTSGMDLKTKNILIPGCGLKTNLQQYILENFESVESVYCTDWSQTALDGAIKNYSHKKLVYSKADSSDMLFESNYFDLVIIANSILSNNDLLNRKMLSECHRVLIKGGSLYGLFPSVFATYEISFLEKQFEHWRRDGTINIYKNQFYEDIQDITQLFYTPLRLRRIVKECNFIRERFEIFFCDSDYFNKESERIYGLPNNSDLVIWEFFLVLRKG